MLFVLLDTNVPHDLSVGYLRISQTVNILIRRLLNKVNLQLACIDFPYSLRGFAACFPNFNFPFIQHPAIYSDNYQTVFLRFFLYLVL